MGISGTNESWLTGRWSICSRAGTWKKWEVYIWLQAKLGLNDQQAHIGMFSDGMCDEVIRLCYKAAAPLGNLHSAA